ncbi:MAG: sodium:proton antiporter [Myxococcota bacterium]
MSFFEVVASLVTLVALVSWVNRRWIRLPSAIGLMLISALLSLSLVALGRLGLPVAHPLLELIGAVDLDRAFLHGMLGALLFAGALHVGSEALLGHWRSIAGLATAGVIASTWLMGSAAWGLLRLIDLSVPYTACLLFGALMAPTDPVAVLAILRDAGVPKSLETKLVGESLFNDGVGVVLFISIADFGLANGTHGLSEAARFAVREIGGGLGWGALLGLIAFELLRRVDDAQVEILLTLAIVTGGYALAARLGISGPLAMVVAGLLLGDRGRRHAMSDATRARVDDFWELIDAFLNAVLFVLIGLEVAALDFPLHSIAAGLVAIPLVLGSRFLTVGLLIRVLGRGLAVEPNAVRIMTWSGLRGGIAIALALSLPQGLERDLIVATTYVVVSFSILVQGLTLGWLVRRLRD